MSQESKPKIYPSFRYHESEDPKIIRCRKDDEELGPGWADSPAAFQRAEKVESSSPDKLPEEVIPAFGHADVAEKKEGWVDSSPAPKKKKPASK